MVDSGSAEFGLSTDGKVLDEVPLERLEEEISSMSSRLAAATATWLVWIAAYDRREGWLSWGAKSCAHWLNWQCGVSPRSAREHVWVARKLDGLAKVRAVFLAGELSYSKVRAICRVADGDSEVELIEMARVTTASQLDRIVAKMPQPDDEIDDEVSRCEVTFKHNDDGSMTMTLTAPVAEMAAVKKGVFAAASAVIDREHVEGETKTDTITRLGGMHAIRSNTAAEILSGTASSVRNAESTVLVVADIEALNGADPEAESTVDGRRVDPEVVRRLCCDAKIQTALVDPAGVELATESEQRIVPRRIRRLLLRRDHGMCQFPGCESDHRLHAHHVVHWTNGGPTELANLISVCDFHHHKVHEGGWNIQASDQGWIFIDPTGQRFAVPVLRLPMDAELPTPEADVSSPQARNSSREEVRQDRRTTAAPLSGTGERANIQDIVHVLTTNAEMRERRRGAATV